MKQLIKDIITNLNDINYKPNLSNNIIKFSNPNKLFKIISINILDINNYKEIFEKNPCMISNIKKIPNKIDLSYYYETALLPSKPLGICKNLYTESLLFSNNLERICS